MNCFQVISLLLVLSVVSTFALEANDDPFFPKDAITISTKDLVECWNKQDKVCITRFYAENAILKYDNYELPWGGVYQGQFFFSFFLLIDHQIRSFFERVSRFLSFRV